MDKSLLIVSTKGLLVIVIPSECPASPNWLYKNWPSCWFIPYKKTSIEFKLASPE